MSSPSSTSSHSLAKPSTGSQTVSGKPDDVVCVEPFEPGEEGCRHVLGTGEHALCAQRFGERDDVLLLGPRDDADAVCARCASARRGTRGPAGRRARDSFRPVERLEPGRLPGSRNDADDRHRANVAPCRAAVRSPAAEGARWGFQSGLGPVACRGWARSRSSASSRPSTTASASSQNAWRAFSPRRTAAGSTSSATTEARTERSRSRVTSPRRTNGSGAPLRVPPADRKLESLHAPDLRRQRLRQGRPRRRQDLPGVPRADGRLRRAASERRPRQRVRALAGRGPAASSCRRRSRSSRAGRSAG